MAVPDFQSFMMPVLKLACESEQEVNNAAEQIADRFSLGDEDRNELLPSGKQTKVRNRTQWAVTYLLKAGLLRRPRRGHFEATALGKQTLDTNPPIIDIKFLSQFEEFEDFRKGAKKDSGSDTDADQATYSGTPEERIAEAFSELNENLKSELLERIIQCEPVFFEHLIIDLMISMGYGGPGSGQHMGKSHDGGIDGIINEDELGLDVVFLQAKRYSPGNNIGVEKIREFAGTLDENGAVKGVFVTTSKFAQGSYDYASRSPKRLILIDGSMLAELMIKHKVAVRPIKSHQLLKIDDDYFPE